MIWFVVFDLDVVTEGCNSDGAEYMEEKINDAHEAEARYCSESIRMKQNIKRIEKVL